MDPKIHQQVVRINFPAIEEWEISATEHLNTILLPNES